MRRRRDRIVSRAPILLLSRFLSSCLLVLYPLMLSPPFLSLCLFVFYPLVRSLLLSCLFVSLSSIPLCSLLLSCLLAISLLAACPLIHARSRSRLPSVGCLSLTHSPRPNTSSAQQIFKREPLFKGKDNNDQLVKIVEMLGKRKLVDYIKKYGLVLSKTLTSLISKYVFLFAAACPLWT